MVPLRSYITDLQSQAINSIYFFGLERTMSDIDRNPAVKILRQLTTEDVLGFTRDDIVGRLGLKSLLNAGERVYFRDIFTLMEERLVWHNKRLEEQKAKRLKQYDMPVSRYQLPTTIRPQKQMAITRTVQQSYLPKKQETLSDKKQPLQKTSNNKYIQSLESKKEEQSKQPAQLQSDPSTTIDSIHLQNPVVRALKPLTHEAIESFTRKQLVGKYGLTKLLTPQQRIYCQQQVLHIQQKLTEHYEMIRSKEFQQQARQAREKEMASDLVERQMTTIHEKKIQIATQRIMPPIMQTKPSIERQRLTVADKQTQTPTVVQYPPFIKNEPQKPTTKQPLENTSKNQVNEEQTYSTEVQPPSRFPSILETFCSLLQKPFFLNSQKRQTSQEWMELDDEEIELLINEDQEATKEERIHKMERKKRD